MIRETGTVTDIETDCLWIETTAKTTCGNCSARQGCGQRILGKLMAKPNAIRVPLGERTHDEFLVGDQVEIGIPENVVVKGALLVYMLPLLGLLAGCGLAQGLAMGEWGTVAVGGGGLLLGAVLVRIHAWRGRNRNRYNPVLLG